MPNKDCDKFINDWLLNNFNKYPNFYDVWNTAQEEKSKEFRKLFLELQGILKDLEIKDKDISNKVSEILEKLIT